jgi:VanZ family protein
VQLRSIFDARWLTAAVAATIVVLGLTHMPQEGVPRCLTANELDKVEHVGTYGLVTLLYLLAVKRQAGWWIRLGIVLGLAAIAAGDEITQPFVHRTCDIRDFACDMVGILLAGAFFVVRRGQGRTLERPVEARSA